MIFREAELKGIYVIDPERVEDERGFFARTWCQHEFQTNGLNIRWVQGNIAFNKRKGTLRGLHYQAPPFEEIKLVRCTLGAIYDVAIDLRLNSPTFKKWMAVELTSENRRMVYIPQGIAHGYQTLADNTEVLYQISEFFHQESTKGVRWNDPAFNIHWPIDINVISDRDRSFLSFQS